jgi:hypothetical protein
MQLRRHLGGTDDKEVPTMRIQRRALVLALTAVLLATLGVMSAHTILAGELDPPAAPGPTMKTLDAIPGSWIDVLETSNGDPGTGCDSSRFVCVMGGHAVLDRETGLTWTRSANQGQAPWLTAIGDALNITVYWAKKGWRLPTAAELGSLLEEGANPALPPDHPFQNVQSANYWTIEAYQGDTTSAWVVNMNGGSIGTDSKLDSNYIWAVRGPK